MPGTPAWKVATNHWPGVFPIFRGYRLAASITPPGGTCKLRAPGKRPVRPPPRAAARRMRPSRNPRAPCPPARPSCAVPGPGSLPDRQYPRRPRPGAPGLPARALTLPSRPHPPRGPRPALHAPGAPGTGRPAGAPGACCLLACITPPPPRQPRHLTPAPHPAPHPGAPPRPPTRPGRPACCPRVRALHNPPLPGPARSPAPRASTQPAYSAPPHSRLLQPLGALPPRPAAPGLPARAPPCS